MANRISVLVALEGADEGLKRAINNAERSLGGFGASAKTASEKAAAGVAEVKAGMNAFGDLRCPSNFVFQRAVPMPPWIADRHAC